MRHFLERIAAAAVVDVVVVFVSFLLATVPPIKVTRTTPCDVFRVVLYFLGGAGLCFSACVLFLELSVFVCHVLVSSLVSPLPAIYCFCVLVEGLGFAPAYTRTPHPARRHLGIRLFRFRVAQGRW